MADVWPCATDLLQVTSTVRYQGELLGRRFTVVKPYSKVRVQLLPVRPKRQLLEHTRRRVTYRRGREIGRVHGAIAVA